VRISSAPASVRSSSVSPRGPSRAESPSRERVLHVEAERAASSQEPAGAASEAAALRSWAKRGTDVVGALVGLVSLSPILLLVAVGIRITSRGPILFRQRRAGTRGVPFTMLKFRTMRLETDEHAHRLHMQAYIGGDVKPGREGRSVKLAGDGRVFPFGAFLRTWSLDELPQLLNVLEGTMSLVGPRPSVHYELEHYQDWHRKRLEAKPGITGLWQVYGRGRTGFDEMARMDIDYIETWSLWQDLKLVVLTIPATLARRGAE